MAFDLSDRSYHRQHTWIDCSDDDMVLECAIAGGVEADVIALHGVPIGTIDVDANSVVSGDDVASAGCRAADEVVARVADVYSLLIVSHVNRARGISADVVTLKLIARRQVALDEDAVACIGTD